MAKEDDPPEPEVPLIEQVFHGCFACSMAVFLVIVLAMIWRML